MTIKIPTTSTISEIPRSATITSVVLVVAVVTVVVGMIVVLVSVSVSFMVRIFNLLQLGKTSSSSSSRLQSVVEETD